MMIFVSSFLSGFSPSLFKSFPFPSFFHPNAFFFLTRKKKVNIVYLFFSFFLSLSLSLFRRCLDTKRARERRRERERFGDDENTVYE